MASKPEPSILWGSGPAPQYSPTIQKAASSIFLEGFRAFHSARAFTPSCFRAAHASGSTCFTVSQRNPSMPNSRTQSVSHFTR